MKFLLKFKKDLVWRASRLVAMWRFGETSTLLSGIETLCLLYIPCPLHHFHLTVLSYIFVKLAGHILSKISFWVLWATLKNKLNPRRGSLKCLIYNQLISTGNQMNPQVAHDVQEEGLEKLVCSWLVKSAGNLTTRTCKWCLKVVQGRLAGLSPACGVTCSLQAVLELTCLVGLEWVVGHPVCVTWELFVGMGKPPTYTHILELVPGTFKSQI